MLSFIITIIIAILAFIALIGILVAVHEFGHAWIAHRLGVKVQRFSIGFGVGWAQMTPNLSLPPSPWVVM